MNTSNTLLFIIFYGLAMLGAVSVVGGSCAAAGAFFSPARVRLLGVATGFGLGVLLLLVARLALCLHLASAGIHPDRVKHFTGPTSPLALKGLAVSALVGITSAVIMSLFASTRLGTKRIRCAWAAGPACVLIALGTASVKSGDHATPETIRGTASEVLNSPLDVSNTNVLLISIDTERADHLTPYGYTRDTSPRLEKLSADGIVFERVLTQRTNTSPAMATVLTGTYPPTHRVLSNHQYLADSNITIAEILSSRGYHTYAVVDNPNLTPEFNYQQGFDELHYDPKPYQIGHSPPVKSQRLNAMILPFLEASRDRKFFLWVHYVDPHGPYLVPEDYRDMFVQDDLARAQTGRIIPIGGGIPRGHMLRSDVVWDSQDLSFLIAQYDSEIRFNDESLGLVLDRLDETGLRENTLVVVTADHGESLSEHDIYFSHGEDTYEPTARVPLIVFHPRLPSGLRVSAPVSLVDLAPTILDLLRIPLPPEMQGDSFAKMLLGQDTTFTRRHHFIIGAHRFGYQTHAVTDERYKLILNVDERWLPLDATLQLAARLWVPAQAFNVYHFRRIRTELYDLLADPAEEHNIAGHDPIVESELASALWQWIDATYAAGARRQSVVPKISDSTTRALKALGYLRDDG